MSLTESDDDYRFCRNCFYWDQSGSESHGFCRRDTPTVVSGETKGYWPITENDDWCGEWEEDLSSEQPSAVKAEKIYNVHLQQPEKINFIMIVLTAILLAMIYYWRT